MIGKQNPQPQRRVTRAELTENIQQKITPEIGRHGNLQRAADFIIRRIDLL